MEDNSLNCWDVNGTLTQKTNDNRIQVDMLLDPNQYKKLDHLSNNEDIYSNFQVGTKLYRIEKNFKSNKKNWYVVDMIVTDVDTKNKMIGTHHPGDDGRMYVGIIYYCTNHKFNLVDYYFKI